MTDADTLKGLIGVSLHDAQKAESLISSTLVVVERLQAQVESFGFDAPPLMQPLLVVIDSGLAMIDQLEQVRQQLENWRNRL